MGFLLEIPALGVVLVAGLALLLAYGFEGTFGQVINWAVGQLQGATIHIPIVGSFNPFGPLIDLLNLVGDTIHRAVGLLEEANSWAWNTFLSFNAYAWQELSAAVGDLAEATDQAIGFTNRHIVPKILNGRLLPIGAAIAWLIPAVHQLYRDIANLAAHPERVIGKTITKIEHLSTTVTHVVYRDIPVAVHTAIAAPKPAIGALERDFTGLEKWVRANIKKVSLVGAVGLVAGVLFSHLRLGWLRCSNTNRVGKFLCGMDRAILDALLAGLTVWLGTLSLEAFAKDVQAVTVTINGEVRHFWRATVTGPGKDRGLGQTGL